MTADRSEFGGACAEQGDSYPLALFLLADFVAYSLRAADGRMSRPPRV
jgi:hypothetical protein